MKEVQSVTTDSNEVKDTIYLKSFQTKGSSDQQVIVNETLRKEIGAYISKNPRLLKDRGIYFDHRRHGKVSAHRLFRTYFGSCFRKPILRMLQVTVEDVALLQILAKRACLCA